MSIPTYDEVNVSLPLGAGRCLQRVTPVTDDRAVEPVDDCCSTFNRRRARDKAVQIERARAFAIVCFEAAAM
jgi:hypothetical protein